MTASFSQLPGLFEELCDASEQDRSHRLAAITDPQLRDRLLALLEADRVASQVMGTAPGQGIEAILARDLASDVLPEHIGAFRILRRLGAGAMGIVYEAEQAHPRRRVALKRLHPWLRSDVALQLFRFEAQALGQVSHPGIPAVYEAGEADGAAYLTMERIDGHPLLAWIHRTRATTEERVRLLVDVGRVVSAAHIAGLVHRDLKPENILVRDDGQPVLLDFGVAAPLLSRQHGAQPGTPLYMSPEQARGEPVGERSDVHALGTIAYQLLTGVLPIRDGSISAIATAKAQLPPSPRTLEPRLDRDAARVILRSLAPAPEDRCSAAAWADDLERTLRAEPLPWGPRPPSYLLERSMRRHRRPLQLAGAAVALTAIALGSFVAVQAYREQSRARSAEQRRIRMVHTIESALADDDLVPATRAFRAFIDDPAHAHTPARVEAWLWWARRQHEHDATAGLDTLAEAWLEAEDPSSSDRIAVALARRFQVDSSWSEAWRLREVLSDAALQEVQGPLREAAIARRDFDAALALGEQDGGMLRQLTRAQPIHLRAQRATWIDVAGDADVELLTITTATSRIHDATGEHELGHIDQPGLVGWLTRNSFLRHDGALWAATQDRGGRITRYAPGADGLIETQVLDGLGETRLLDFDVVHTPGGPRFLLAAAYPVRKLLWVDPERGLLPSLHPGTDALESDVMSVLVHDLDGDDTEEIVVSVGAWSADEVRVLRQKGDGYELAGRLSTGTVRDLALLPRVGQRPLILATKGDLELNRRLYPSDTGFGPPAGLYLLDWDGAELRSVGFLPLPVRDGARSGPEQLAANPIIGDFDGDGTLDVATSLEHLDLGPRTAMWIVLDVLGARRSLVLAGLYAHGSADLDKDGDDELLIGDDDGQLWIVGTGDQRLPIWDRPAGLTTLGASPSTDPLVQRSWVRAQQLVSVGLPSEAIQALSLLPGLTEQPEARRAANLAAAQLLESAGDPGAAERLYDVAHREHPDDSGAADGLIRTRIATLDLQGARAVDHTREPWLDQVPPPVRLLDAATLADWTLQHAGVFHERDGGLELEVFNDHGVLASRQVRVDGPVIGLDLDLEITGLELGSGLAVELVGGPNRREVLVAFWGQGGGGATKVYQHCADTSMQDIGSDPFEGPVRIRMSALRSGAEGKLRCRTDSTLRSVLPVYDTTPLAPGIYTLQLRAHGVENYHPPTRLRARLHHLDGVGLASVPSVPSAQETARQQLYLGRSDASPADEEAAWGALARGDAAALRDALANLWERGDRRRLRWLLRSSGSDVVVPLASVAGTGFPALFEEAWDAKSTGGFVDPSLHDELLRPSLAMLPASDPAGARLRLERAEVRLQRGDRARARTLAESVLAEASDVAPKIDAWLLLARLAESEAEAHEAEEQAIALDPTGRTQERVRRERASTGGP